MPSSTGLKLPKSSRIHHRSLQEKLFAEGAKIHEFPLKMVWNAWSAEQLNANFRDRVPDLIGPVQVLVSVPKKKRRKAVDRVLMRRRIREAFRLHRPQLLDLVGTLPGIRTLSIGIVYQKEANVDFGEVERKMLRLFEKLSVRVREKVMEKNEEATDHPSDTAD